MRKANVVAAVSLTILALLSGCDQNERKIQGGVTDEKDGSMCALDTINGTAAVPVTKIKQPGTLLVTGWAVDSQNRTAPSDVSLELISEDSKEKITAVANRGAKRPDVAKVYNESAFEGGGFAGRVNIDKAKPGRYSIRIVQKSGTTSLTCDLKRAIEIQ